MLALDVVITYDDEDIIPNLPFRGVEELKQHYMISNVALERSSLVVTVDSADKITAVYTAIGAVDDIFGGEIGNKPYRYEVRAHQ